MTSNNSDQDGIIVSVFMITYLHAKYIAQAINGVLSQECDFPIELIIADDNSPDNTEEVVNEVLKSHPRSHLVRYTKHKQNKGMHGNFQWTTDVARGKYIAQCEGDDYWIDPYKLQKQVDFLENNPDYGLVYTRAKTFEQDKQEFSSVIQGKEILHKDSVLYQNPITSLTTCYRSSLNQEYLKENGEKRKNWLMGDYPKWIWFSYNSKIQFLEDITAVYRKLENSASHFAEAKRQMAFKKNTIGIQKYFAKKYMNSAEYSEFINYLVYHYYYSALIVDPTNSRTYYNEIKDTEGLSAINKFKLFALEKLYLKNIYRNWISFRRKPKK